MAVGTVDYTVSYFKYKTPTPIQGAPTNKTLKRLKQELQANASSVESDLGGGDPPSAPAFGGRAPPQTHVLRGDAAPHAQVLAGTTDRSTFPGSRCTVQHAS